jgi:CubicO group peptidase (beta-lactamase class C family)
MSLSTTLEPHVTSGAVPGLVALVGRGGQVTEISAIGSRELGGNRVTPDSIFRISSVTKPITAAATLILVSDGLIDLDAPIERWLPELANRRVLRSIEAELDDTVAVDHPPTVRELLTFTWGFGTPIAPPGKYPIQRAVAALPLCQSGPPKPSLFAPPDEWIRLLGTLPLMHQPGARWMYNTAADVLAVLIARVAKQPFGDLLRERVFEPLHMRDTAFWCADRERFTTAYAVKGDGLEVFDPIDGEWSRAPAFPSGAAGLVSTVGDLHEFGAMLVSGGGDLLPEPLVRAMLTSQLTDAQRAASNDFVGYFTENSWGYGGGVVVGNDPSGAPGAYGWDGGTGTTFRVDPAAGKITILLSTRSFTSPKAPDHITAFWRATRV